MTTSDDAAVDPRIENTISMFSTIYLGGIPSIIPNESAFLSFLYVLSATEALVTVGPELLSAWRPKLPASR